MTSRHPNHRPLASLPPELRRTRVPDEVRTWVRRELGAPVTGLRRLAGASSTAVHGLRLRDGRRVVLRRYVWPGFLDDEPIAPAREVDALRFASAAGLAAPDLLAADVTGNEIGDGIPALVMSLLPGRAVAVPDLHRLAEAAASVHGVDAAALGHEYFRWYDRETHRPVPTGTTQPRLWEAAADVWRGEMPAYEPGLTHRDFHPGNLLWSRGRLTGIVDWANACRGPWGCDVAHCRENLIGLSGWEAADGFQRAYEELTGRTHHPFWEVASVLEHGPATMEAKLAVYERRLTTALGALGALPRRLR